jgi:hypothetical protein
MKSEAILFYMRAAMQSILNEAENSENPGLDAWLSDYVETLDVTTAKWIDALVISSAARGAAGVAYGAIKLIDAESKTIAGPALRPTSQRCDA